MTRKQFRHDMRRGLGSCQFALDQCKNIEDYRSEVLWGMQYAPAYDAQCEGTRAIYLFEMIEHFDDWSEFHAFAAAGAKRNLKDRGWRFAHYTEILALMAGAGYEPARQTMAELYEQLIQAIRAGRPSRNGIWGAMDNFSRLCVSTLTNDLQTQVERERFFLRVLADYGRLIKEKPALSERCEDEWFEWEAAEHLGEERVQELLNESKENPDVARYIKNRDDLQAKYAACRAQRRQDAEAETAQSIYDKLREGQTVPHYLLFQMERLRGPEELTRFAQIYAREARADLREAMLELMWSRGSSFTFNSAISQLLRDAEDKSDGLRNKALCVLRTVRSDRVRNYALCRLERSRKDVNTLYMLLSNFQPGDGRHLIPLVKSVSLNEHYGDWHGVFSDIRDLIEQNSDADRELSAKLLPYILREGYCSCCRLYTLRLMQPRGLLTPELIEECRRDCYLEIREYFEGL